jgi:hypothetical protein
MKTLNFPAGDLYRHTINILGFNNCMIENSKSFSNTLMLLGVTGLNFMPFLTIIHVPPFLNSFLHEKLPRL